MNDAIVEHPAQYAAESARRAARPRVAKAAARAMMRGSGRFVAHELENRRGDATMSIDIGAVRAMGATEIDGRIFSRIVRNELSAYCVIRNNRQLSRQCNARVIIA